MKQIEIRPIIYEFETFAQFAEEFGLGEKDVILTNEYIYRPTIEKTGLACQTIFQEKYGAGEPSDVMVNCILEQMNEMEAERIVAVGGGTIIDIAKVMAVADGAKDINELYENMGKLKKQHELIVIPTTCGTGSEVTNIAVLNRTTINAKQGLVSDAMYADNAVLIAEFIGTLPYNVFAASSIDALIHAAESYLSPFATEYTKMFSEAAIRDILTGYVQIAESHEALKDLGGMFLRASNYAGIAFSTAGCGAVHALSYALGGKYHVAHGESNYQFFMPVLNLYRCRQPEGSFAKLDKLFADCLGTDDGIKALGELLEKILTRKPMSAYGAVEEDIEPFTCSTIENQQRLLGKAYVPLSEAEIREIFTECLN